jgi:hypothetical protein
MKFELKYPLLNRNWKWLAYSLFPFPFVFLLIATFTPVEIQQKSVADLFYLSWAIGFGLLNFTKEKQEDEMIEQLRLKSFAMGVYYLIWGLAVSGIFQLFRFGSLFTDYMSAYLAIWLLNTYIFASFQYYKWKNS